MQLLEIIALPLGGKNATWLDDVPAKFADRKIARIFRVFKFSAIFQKLLLPAQNFYATHRNLYMRGQCNNLLRLHCHHE